MVDRRREETAAGSAAASASARAVGVDAVSVAVAVAAVVSPTVGAAVARTKLVARAASSFDVARLGHVPRFAVAAGTAYP